MYISGAASKNSVLKLFFKCLDCESNMEFFGAAYIHTVKLQNIKNVD